MNSGQRHDWSTASSAFAAQKKAGGRTTYQERRQLLKRFETGLRKWRPKFHEAVAGDLRREPLETDMAEFLALFEAFKYTGCRLKKWMRPKCVRSSLIVLGTKSKIVYEPKGVVLIISPWNYPVNLTLMPMIDAMAAGNRVIVKPSELTPKTSEVIREFVADTFDPLEAHVFTGGRERSSELLELPFDHIMFTGSPGVGKVVMEAAAKNLTPVTLELGGKSPVFVDRNADLKSAAEKIMWAKRLNSGQTCLAPDYLLVDRAAEKDFFEEVRKAIAKFEIKMQPVINERHFDRVQKALQESVRQGAAIEFGGEMNLRTQEMSLTVLNRVRTDHAIMSEEIFGPVLPVMLYDDLQEAIDLVNGGDKPLSLYVFSRDRQYIDRVVANTSSGGVCVNDSMIHFANPNLPFGGIGVSGMGAYHGHFGFLTFSHQKAVVTRGWFDPAKFLYPPYRPILKKFFARRLGPR
ncbi:MAG: aldehyde dehydrogenase family protein [Bdellovibrionia bacterium]